jgi:predicted DNA-binding helix-hairpin-helix protein
MRGLYDRLNLKIIYFSAYQKGLGDASIDEETKSHLPPADPFIREHRLYQVDFLMRRYGFTEPDICFDKHWTRLHPDYFPINIKKASRYQLLRVPGLGEMTVSRILEQRKAGRINSICDIGRATSRLNEANEYLCF